MEKIYEIQGMKCDGCAKKVTESFEKVPGVEKVTVDLAKKQALVVGNPEKQALADSLVGTHFTLI